MITVSDINQDEENYVWWLTIMPDVLLRLAELPKALRESLDYSISSLDAIEKYLMENYSFEEMKDVKNKYARDLFARYIGETFRKNLENCYWTIDLEDRKNVFYGLPVLIVKEKQNVAPISPYFLVIALLDRQKGNFLSSILKNIQKTN